MDGKVKLPNTSTLKQYFFPQTVLCYAASRSSLILPGCCCLSLFPTNAWPHHPEHTARVQLATNFPLLNWFIFLLFTITRTLLPKQSQYHLALADTFSSSCRNVCFLLHQILFLGRKGWKIPHSYSFFTSDSS